MSDPEVVGNTETDTDLDLVACHENTLLWYESFADLYAGKIADLLPSEIRIFESKLARGSKVLDLGCAGGRDTNYLSDEHDVTGVDAVEEFIALAKASYPDCKFMVANAEALSFGDGSFDAICMRSVLLHMSDDMIRRVLNEAKRVVKPGGIGFIRMKVRTGDKKYVVGSIEKRTNSTRLFNLFHEEELISLIESVGLRVTDCDVEKDDDDPSRSCFNILVRF
jgi:ubiquinone/menaquinone biosynthesis C-methylase UbiE